MDIKLRNRGALLGLLINILAMGSILSPCFAETPIKIGVILCQTGFCAQTGTSSLKGVQLASEEINATGGILGHPVQLLVQDTHEADSGSGAVTAFRAVTSDPAVGFIVGPTWDVGGLPLVPILKRAKNLILISPSIGVVEFSGGSDNIFNLWPLDETAVKALARFSIEKGFTRAGILSGQLNWTQVQSRNFKNEFELGGGQVVSLEEPLPSQTDVSTEVTRVLQSKPDVILLTQFAQMPPAAMKFRQQGFTGAFLSIQMDSDRIKSAHGALEGTVFPRFQAPANQFVSSFQKRFSEQPQMSADTAYDSLFLIKKAAEKAGSIVPAKVRSEMEKVSFEGASGAISFDENRVIRKVPALHRVSGDKYLELGD